MNEYLYSCYPGNSCHRVFSSSIIPSLSLCVQPSHSCGYNILGHATRKGVRIRNSSAWHEMCVLYVFVKNNQSERGVILSGWFIWITQLLIVPKKPSSRTTVKETHNTTHTMIYIHTMIWYIVQDLIPTVYSTGNVRQHSIKRHQ